MKSGFWMFILCVLCLMLNDLTTNALHENEFSQDLDILSAQNLEEDPNISNIVDRWPSWLDQSGVQSTKQAQKFRSLPYESEHPNHYALSRIIRGQFSDSRPDSMSSPNIVSDLRVQFSKQYGDERPNGEPKESAAMVADRKGSRMSKHKRGRTLSINGALLSLADMLSVENHRRNNQALMNLRHRLLIAGRR